jgi:hypothetical protein
MTRAARILGLSAVLWATGCGSSSSNNNNPSQPTTGTATFTGAATGTLNVSVLAGYETPATYVGFFIDSTPGSYPNVSFTAKLPGSSLQTGTFTSANVTQAVTIYLSTGPGEPAWEQAFVAAPPQQAGTFTLSVSSVGPTTGDSTVTDWPSTHGSFSATLPPLLMATGEVNMSLTF